jgi:NTE family protein
MWMREGLQPDYDIEPECNCNLPIKSPVRKMKRLPHTLLLSGGSTKGTAHVGAIRAIDELGFMNHIRRFVGVSVGGLIASLLCIGYTVDELYNEMMLLDFSSLQDLNPRMAFDNLGIDKGDKFIKVIKKYIAKKMDADVTLSDIYKKTHRSIHLIAARLNDSKPVIFNHRTEPDMPLWKAIRMTVSIPFLFTPVLHRGHMYVDGACIDNFPITLFPSRRTIGIMLRVAHQPADVKNMEDLVKQLFIMMMANTSKSANKYPDRTVNVVIPPISNVDFKMSAETKLMLHNLGYHCCMEHYTDTL